MKGELTPRSERLAACFDLYVFSPNTTMLRSGRKQAAPLDETTRGLRSFSSSDTKNKLPPPLEIRASEPPLVQLLTLGRCSSQGSSNSRSNTAGGGGGTPGDRGRLRGSRLPNPRRRTRRSHQWGGGTSARSSLRSSDALDFGSSAFLSSELGFMSDAPVLSEEGGGLRRGTGEHQGAGIDATEGEDDTATAYSWEFTIASSHVGNTSLGGASHPKNHKGGLYSGRSGSGNHLDHQQPLRFSRPAAANRRLADLTVNKLQFLKLGRLYGREHECRALRDAWQDVRSAWRTMSLPLLETPNSSSTGSSSQPSTCAAARRFVSISGASGTGKSALAESLRGSVTRCAGFFLLGKFPQRHGHVSRHVVEPYSAFEAACNELCELIVSLYEPQGGVDHDESSSLGASWNGSQSEWSGWGTADHHHHRPDPDEGSVSSRKYLKFTLAQVREHLNRELGAEAAVLTRVIPSLLQLLRPGGAPPTSQVAASSSNSSDVTIGYREAHLQFKFAFRRFLRAVTRFGPMVLVLDDLHWADTASLDLLEALLSDRENKSILIVACYRDDDEYSALPHVPTLEAIRSLAMAPEASDLRCDAVEIGNLEPPQVHQLLVDLLSLPETDTQELAECVHKKTLGNVFFVIQYLTLLQDSGLLVYNIGAFRWTFDLPAIQVSTAATDNVVSLMTNKMKRFPRPIQLALPVMACLGTSFSLSVCDLLIQHFAPTWIEKCQDADASTEFAEPEPEQEPEAEQPVPASDFRSVRDCLDHCELEGLVDSGVIGGVECYQWAHDKIQEAAFALASDTELAQLKLEIGRVLYEQLDSLELNQNIFTVVNLLTTESPAECTGISLSPIKVAQLCLFAGVRTIENSAFEQAAGYLATGIGLMPLDRWEKHYDLCLELYSTAAEAEFCVANFDRMRGYCQEVIDQEARPLLDKRRVYNVLLDCTAAQEGMAAAFAFCQSILAKLGCRFPKRAVKMHVMAVILRVKARLKTYTASETYFRLPLMEDEKNQWLMALLDKFARYTYLTHPNLLPLVIFKGLRLTLTHGVSDYSPPMFAFVGLLLTAFVHDYHGGQAFANQAIDLLKVVRYGRKVESRVLFQSHALVLHWTRPVALSLKPLLASYEVGMAMGDTESAGWSISFHLEHSFRTGTSLKVLLDDCAFYAQVMRDVKQRTNMLNIILNLWQCVLHLTDANPFSGKLMGDVRNQDEALKSVSGKDHTVLHASIHRMLMYVAFLFGEHELVYESIRSTNMDKGFIGTYYHHFCLAWFAELLHLSQRLTPSPSPRTDLPGHIRHLPPVRVQWPEHGDSLPEHGRPQVPEAGPAVRRQTQALDRCRGTCQ